MTLALNILAHSVPSGFRASMSGSLLSVLLKPADWFDPTERGWPSRSTVIPRSKYRHTCHPAWRLWTAAGRFQSAERLHEEEGHDPSWI